MRGDDVRTVISIPSTATSNTATTSSVKKVSSGNSFSTSKNGYKFWVLAAFLLLALWSMVTGSVTLKWSTGNLTRLSDDPDFTTHDDLDVLEVEEKEKVVRRMWDVYSHSTTTKLPRFWQEAFDAAYEALVSEVPAVRNDAVSEIAKIALRSVNLERLPFGTTKCQGQGYLNPIKMPRGLIFKNEDNSLGWHEEDSKEDIRRRK